MEIIYSEEHKLRDSKTELSGGQLVPPFECPVRAEYVVDELKRRQVGDIQRGQLIIPADQLLQ